MKYLLVIAFIIELFTGIRFKKSAGNLPESYIQDSITRIRCSTANIGVGFIDTIPNSKILYIKANHDGIQNGDTIFIRYELFLKNNKIFSKPIINTIYIDSNLYR